MTEKRFTVEEMQNWNKRYKLDKETAKCVIDTFDGGEYWTVHGNEAYNLCIDMNALSDENEQLKTELKDCHKSNHEYYRDKGKLIRLCERFNIDWKKELEE